MKQKKLLFVDIISVLFIVLIMVITFFSVLYLTNGEKAISAIISVVIVLSYYFNIELLKRNKEYLLKNNFKHYSVIFWFMFIGLASVTFYLMLHLLNIEMNCKNLIQKDAESKIAIIDNKVNEYKIKAKRDLIDFPIDLKTKLAEYKRDHHNSSLKNQLTKEPYNIDDSYLNDYSQIDPDGYARVETSVRAMVINKNIMQLDSMVKKQLNPQKIVFLNWDRMNLVTAYNELNKFVGDKQNDINKLINQLPLSNSFTVVSINYNQLPLNNPEELRRKYQPNILIPVISILIIHFFLLISYFNLNIKTYTKKSNRGVIEY